jgi:ABC-type Zn uptake system ZnuABC Zn-binding protein ZnuA
MKKVNTSFIASLSLMIILALAACSPQAEQSAGEVPAADQKYKVVATTSIIGDVVSQVGDDLIALSVLLPVGTDPHSFDPTPQDIAKVAEADLIFANGAGLEEFLDNLVESAGAEDKVIYLSDGIDFLKADGDDHDHENENAGVDPHTWTDPNNVMVWIRNIEEALSELDPQNAASYDANAGKYQAELEALDVWIRDQVELVPAENRKLVTDHKFFAYFADRYGFEQVGALIPAYSTLAEPTAQELSKIEDAIRQLDVKAIFVGNSVNPALAERVSEDTGTALISIYTGSLSEPGDQADTYLEYMRYNTSIFVNALR